LEERVQVFFSERARERESERKRERERERERERSQSHFKNIPRFATTKKKG
jgi:hypothetical protein